MTSHFTYTVHGSGPGLLLAHGAGGSAEANFGPVLPELAAGYTVVAPDYPGPATPRVVRGRSTSTCSPTDWSRVHCTPVSNGSSSSGTRSAPQSPYGPRPAIRSGSLGSS